MLRLALVKIKPLHSGNGIIENVIYIYTYITNSLCLVRGLGIELQSSRLKLGFLI
jgi:hypothetical protein